MSFKFKFLKKIRTVSVMDDVALWVLRLLVPCIVAKLIVRIPGNHTGNEGSLSLSLSLSLLTAIFQVNLGYRCLLKQRMMEAFVTTG